MRRPQSQDGLVDLHRLRLMSVVLPVGFIVALEAVYFATVHRGHLFWVAYLLFVLVPVVSVVVFASVMFHFIERAQRQVLRQNRELAATNLVASAIRGQLGVAQIVEAALSSALEASGAAEASVTVFTADDQPLEGGSTSRRWSASSSVHPGPGDQGGRAGPVIDVPLSTGTSTIGVLSLQLPFAAQQEALSSGTQRSIGHQLGSAIQIAQLVDDLQRRKHEGHGFYDILLQISNQKPIDEVLVAVVRHARALLSSDQASLRLTDEVCRSIHLTALTDMPRFGGKGSCCIMAETGERHHPHGGLRECPVRSDPGWTSSMVVPVGAASATLGELWIGRRSENSFTSRDRSFLDALSGLAAIAITGARLRESENQAAILAERERIAREMHDSLAQVLGATHLRLRALIARPEVSSVPRVSLEVGQLAEICEEAYRDVREAILGLRESSRADRGLLESLRVYVEKFSQQSGVATSLDSSIDHELVLPPRCEVQVIRVIQEALTNVRKHSGARTAVVRITQGPSSMSFVVEDDGDGFDPEITLFDRDGFGMYTMLQRMTLLNGNLTVDSTPGGGTRVVAVVPVLSNAKPFLAKVNGAGP